MQTLVRQATAAGVYPNGYRSFADDMSWYGARLATGDLLNPKTLLDLRNSAYVAKLFAPLRTTANPSIYNSSQLRPLLQWGTHIVPLTPTTGTVAAKLTGATSAGAAAWRWAIVSLSADGTPRYSALGSASGTTAGNTVTLAAASGEKVYLVVTATPYASQSLGWQPDVGAVQGNKSPYSVTLTGATPLTLDSRSCNSVPAGQQGQDLNYNTNGNTTAPVACR